MRASLLGLLLCIGCILCIGCPGPTPPPLGGPDGGLLLSDSGLDAFDVGTDAGADAGAADVGSADASDGGCATPLARGVWMYRHPGNPLGTDIIVGSAAEAAAIAQLTTDSVGRVYGNYGDRPAGADAPAIRSWNAQLHAAGIESHLLMGEGTDIFPGCREDLLKDITDRLISFNAAGAAAEQFVALHLDIEPQQYDLGASYPTTTSCGLRIADWPFWDDATAAARATRYEMLLQTFVDIRAHLDAAGLAALPIHVDLAPWIDSSASFDWTSTPFTDGTDWLTQVSAVVEGATFMTYERSSEAMIDSSVSAESALAFEARVSVSAKERDPLSTVLTWTGLPAMWAVVEDVENTHCGSRAVDVFNYRYMNE